MFKILGPGLPHLLVNVEIKRTKEIGCWRVLNAKCFLILVRYWSSVIQTFRVFFVRCYIYSVGDRYGLKAGQFSRRPQLSFGHWPSGRSPCVSWDHGSFSQWRPSRLDIPLRLALKLLAATECQKWHLSNTQDTVLLCDGGTAILRVDSYTLVRDEPIHYLYGHTLEYD